MLNSEFIEFVNSIFPNFPDDVKDRAKASIQQFEIEGKQKPWLMSSPLDMLSQGDIISNIPFFYFDKDGRQKLFIADGILISTSCHIDHKDKLSFAPVFPIDVYPGVIDELKRNTVYDYMYIQDTILSDKYIDFEIINTYEKELITSSLSSGKVKRISSLNDLGYYVFIIKLTVYLLRREDQDTLNKRGEEVQ